jgi:hypothetical protein
VQEVLRLHRSNGIDETFANCAVYNGKTKCWQYLADARENREPARRLSGKRFVEKLKDAPQRKRTLRSECVQTTFKRKPYFC